MASEVETAGPALGLSGPETVAVLETAALAPSVHNTQPWSFRVAPDVIELHLDPARRLPVADPDDQELRLACGAALFNLRLALLARGVRPAVALYAVVMLLADARATRATVAPALDRTGPLPLTTGHRSGPSGAAHRRPAGPRATAA